MTIQVSSSIVEDLGLSSATEARDAYLTKLLSQCQTQDLQVVEPETVALLKAIRARAILSVTKLPTKRDEEWRFTDISPLLEVNFQAANKFDLADATAAEFTLPEATISLVFVNGVYNPKLSTTVDLPTGLFVGNLAQLPETHKAKVGKYLAQQPGATEVFTAINTASLTDAAVVWLAKNTVVETPIQLLFVSTTNETATVSQPRCLVVAEVGSVVTLIEDYRTDVGVGLVDSTENYTTASQCQTHPYFTNAVTEIFLGENAQVSHNRIQRESKTAFHIGKTSISQSRDSRYTCNAISVGSHISRHNLEAFQTGEQTETTFNGLTMISGEQLADTHSVMAYTKPYGTSNQLHKCIVADKAHAVFNGKVFVPQAAQLTNAAQLNRNLLLSPKARVDTKPQLEITADNVKCSHGATVGQLEADELFYLQSRGLKQTDARNLLINAFAAEIINQLPIASLREQLSQLVREISH
jgi:Fe-S cluster assembly protein SufD